MNNYRESKIPSTAKRVFTGKIFDVYQWEQEMFDETIQTFEKLTRPDTASVIAVTTEGKILITEQEQPGTSQCLCMPGGRVDTGETPLITAQRELLEETGYGGGNWEQFLGISRYSKIDYCFYVFIARGVSKHNEPKLDPGEKIDMKEVSFNEFIDILVDEKFEDNDLALYILRLQRDPIRFSAFRKLLEM
jgi:8-oxo-dGTP pyrophosphatase MutT (NUDIX family)